MRSRGLRGLCGRRSGLGDALRNRPALATEEREGGGPEEHRANCVRNHLSRHAARLWTNFAATVLVSHPAMPDDTRVEQSKFDLGAVAPRLESGQLPWGYGENRITAIVRDPDSAYLYWEITDD